MITQLQPDDDWRMWRSMRLDALADSPTAFGSLLADWIDAGGDRWRARLRDVPLNVIAMLDDEPAGQVSGMQDGSSMTVELISMWVSPTARGAGVGDALIDTVARWATEDGAETVGLSVQTSNGPAVRLYERNGFSITGPGMADDEVRMMRTL